MAEVQSLERRARDLDDLLRDVLAMLEVNWQAGTLTACDSEARAKFVEIVGIWRQRQRCIMEAAFGN